MNVLPLIILFPLISGFLFASNFEPLRYKIDRAENNRLYFLSAFYGFILFAFSSLLFLLLLFEKGVFNDFLKSINYKFGIQLSNIEEYIVVILLITMVLGPLLGKVLDLVIPERLRLKFYKRAIKDNDFDKLFLKSVEKQMPVLLSMASRKVYVGWILQTTNPSKENTEITILPMMSGYITGKTKRVRFTTYYDEIYDRILESEGENPESSLNELIHLEVDDFEVVLPFHEIISGRLFDLTAFYEFSAQER